MCHQECFSSCCLPLLCTDTKELSTTTVRELLHIIAVLKCVVPCYPPPVPLRLRQALVPGAGVTRSQDFSCVLFKSKKQKQTHPKICHWEHNHRFSEARTLVCTVLVGGGCSLIQNDVLVFSREGKVLRDRRQGAGLALALVLVHLWLCNIKCTALRVESWCQRRPGCRPSRGSLPALWDGSFGCLVLHQAGEFVQTRLLTDDTVGPPGIPEQALLHAQEYWPTLGAPGEPRLASPNKRQLSAVDAMSAKVRSWWTTAAASVYCHIRVNLTQ